MAAVVGGRMEAVAPRRSLYGPDYLLLVVLAVVSAGVHLWLVAHTSVTARDSIGFGRYALGLQSPESSLPEGPHLDRSKVDVIKAAQHPPGYPLAVWVTAKFVRRGTTLALPDSTLLATQIVSSFAALVLVVPMYLTGRMLFGRSVGFAAALLFQVLPVPAHLTSDGLSEGLYLLVSGTAVMLAVRAVRRPGVGGFLACGAAVGLDYLVRPEALLVAASTATVAVWLGLTRRWPRDLALGRLTALAVGVALVAAPYVILIGKFSNKPTATHLTDPGENPRAKLFKGGPDARANPVGGGPLFAKWMESPVEGTAGRVAWGVEAVAEETTKSLNYGAAVFAVVGLVALRRRVAAEPGLWVLLVLAALNTGLLVYLGTRVGYVSERHTVLLVMIGCLFAAAALEPVANGIALVSKFGGPFWGGKFGPVALLVILVGASLPSALKPLHANRAGHKHAGRWLAEALREHEIAGEKVAIVDPFEWAQFYSTRTLHNIPPDPPDATVIYAVLEPNASTPHSRLPRLELAEDVARGGKMVYFWPEDGPPERAKVAVYKTTR